MADFREVLITGIAGFVGSHLADCILADLPDEAEVVARVSVKCFGKLKSPVRRIGLAATPCPTARHLENELCPSASSMIRAAEKVVGLEPADLSGEEFFSHEERSRGPF